MTETLGQPELAEGLIGVHTARGNLVKMAYREGTSDLGTIGATFRLWGKLEDEYDLSGVAIDIGAHIGTVALALLADHPRLKVIAVEPLAENVAMIAKSAAENGLADRLTILHAGISDSDTATVDWNWRATTNEGYWRTNRFIGNVMVPKEGEYEMAHDTAVVPGVSLKSLLPKGRAAFLKSLLPKGRAAFLKIDCEGCEWVALKDPAVKRIDVIAGEYHGHPGPEGLEAMLGKTHVVTHTPEGACGMFRAVKR
jgi:FkbM family methyltransferase